MTKYDWVSVIEIKTFNHDDDAECCIRCDFRFKNEGKREDLFKGCPRCLSEEVRKFGLEMYKRGINSGGNVAGASDEEIEEEYEKEIMEEK